MFSRVLESRRCDLEDLELRTRGKATEDNLPAHVVRQARNRDPALFPRGRLRFRGIRHDDPRVVT